MRVLALDISTSVGWALFAGEKRVPRLGTWRAPPAQVGDYAKRCVAFETWLNDFTCLDKPDVLAFESPIFVKWSSDLATNEHTIRTLIGLATVAEMVAWRLKVRALEVHSQTAKKRLTGNGRAKGDDMIVAAVKLGFVVANDHEADAIAVGLCAYDHVRAEARPGVLAR